MPSRHGIRFLNLITEEENIADHCIAKKPDIYVFDDLWMG